MNGAARHRLRGVLSPVLTPFGPDGKPSTTRFVRHCRWLLDQGVGLAAFGTNSEANSLSTAEKMSLLDVLLDAGLPADRMMPGTGACALPDAIAMTRHAVDAGCAGVLMLPPFYYKGVSDEGLFRSFASVIDAVADRRLRVYLYNIPPMTQVPLSLGLIERLLKAYPDAIAGVKDSSGDWTHTHAMLREFQPEGFDVFAGSETFLLQTMRAGGAGCITATGNVNPTAILRLYREWQQPDAPVQQAALDATRALFQRHPIIAAMKSAIAWKSADEQWAAVRTPLIALNATQREQLEADLAAEGFTIPKAETLAGNDASCATSAA
ncbi:dihydrodipicolinate synthase family protein [Variovorax sp. 770b2]|uniref:dihydrodipicolinate synthase family protein n=1 Tax=Variovorax sp. 770b2 TaxID=1566271 RepID=UPI0008E6B069|nr:dihydrodipicolinate synthase family protein [Variovorax sp. 770b2]SFP45654.1 4-hydroxy-tetrahydrodipicolinate synthase [Variovorax sp. 770b2]